MEIGDKKRFGLTRRILRMSIETGDKVMDTRNRIWLNHNPVLFNDNTIEVTALYRSGFFDWYVKDWLRDWYSVWL